MASRVGLRMGTGSGFCDEGHLQYYQDTKKILTPKKLKLLKGFSKLGLASDPEKLAMFHDLQQNLTSVQFYFLYFFILVAVQNYE